ncbi:HtaA domain-containing protein [Nocardioides sp. Arc9.136]|uniref:HtaA domain-containing protein n=1 Tax=Nocardioides sp. Arc9.136 TaxID=2996826 RepID=UPI0026656BA3|nr:HtaA domain-containing protein [Nocardioides sp. Arc9.136]WKN47680.1 HtaA domain-containing protein [Nocardioides sp. Arc9.136]
MIRPTRWAASAAATTMAASGLALVATAAPATAAPATAAAAPSLTWEISQQFDDHLSSHELAGGATEAADGVVTFPDGVGSYDPATGAGSVSYAGSVAGTFKIPMVGTAVYTVTFAQPRVTVEADGDGTISALVSAKVNGGMGQPASDVAPARVTVTTFDAPAWTVADGLGSITATPAWDGVLPEGPGSAALGIPAGQPVDGKAWAADLLGHLPSGLRAHFHASGASSDAKKAPAALTARATPAAAAAPAVSHTATTSRSGVAFTVSGTGFDGTTNPGDNGVYVGLAEAGGLPETDDMADQSEFVAAAWVPAAQVVGGAFTTSLTAPAAKLERGTSYSLYTWQAHTHSNTSQDTETPVTIDWAALGGKTEPRATVAVTKKPTSVRAGRLRVAYTGDAGTVGGKVTVRIARAATSGRTGKVVATRTARLAGGRATVALPRLAKGGYRIKVVYAGSSAYERVARTVALKVAR